MVIEICVGVVSKNRLAALTLDGLFRGTSNHNNHVTNQCDDSKNSCIPRPRVLENVHSQKYVEPTADNQDEIDGVWREELNSAEIISNKN